MNPIRIGVVGAGHWGPNLVRNFSVLPDSDVIAVADKDASRLKILRERYPSVRLSESAEDVLTSPDIDAAVVCRPTTTHFKLARAALESGKHVFVEKPMATSAAECRILEQVAETAGRLLFVGHVFVYNAGIRYVKEYIDGGELGQLYRGGPHPSDSSAARLR